MSANKPFSASTLLIVAVLCSAAAFAAGRSVHSESPSTASAAITSDPAPVMPAAIPESTGLPPGHPPVETTGANAPMPAAEAAESTLAWKVPARWQVAPNTSSMRLATYRIPPDAEMSVSQAGGSVDANAERWIGQFGSEAKKTAKRTTKKVASLPVTIVEVEGTFGEKEGWALVGAIVETPGMPHFFKMTGPAKSVRAARAELDELVASLSTK